MLENFGNRLHLMTQKFFSSLMFSLVTMSKFLWGWMNSYEFSVKFVSSWLLPGFPAFSQRCLLTELKFCWKNWHFSHVSDGWRLFLHMGSFNKVISFCFRNSKAKFVWCPVFVPNKTLSLPKSKQTIKNATTDLGKKILTSKFPKMAVEWGFFLLSTGFWCVAPHW